MGRLMLLALAVVCGIAAGAEEPKPQPSLKRPPNERPLKGDDEKTAADLEKKSSLAEEENRFDEAIKLREELLALRTKVQGADYWETVNARCDLETTRKVASQPAALRAEWVKAHKGSDEAMQLYEKGRYAQAQSLWDDYRRLCEKVLGEKNISTTFSYNNLAAVLKAQGRYAEAEVLYQKALGVRRELLGEQHPNTANSYNNLAHNLTDEGKYESAQPLYQKALDIRRELFGEMHTATANSYNNLAYNLDAQGKYRDAQSLFQKALDVYLQLLGDNHPITAISYNNVAAVLRSQGRYADAQPLNQKALDIKRETLGEKHPETGLGYISLARNLNIQGRYVEAQPIFQKALDLNRELLGEKHPVTANCYDGVAANLQAQGRYAEAQPIFQKALDLNHELFGDNHPKTAASYNALALNLQAQGKYADAQTLLQKALDLRLKLLGEKHPDTAATYNYLAAILRDQKRYADAQPLYRKALDLARELLGDKHPAVVVIHNNMALNHHAQGMYGEARDHLERAASAYEAARLNVAGRGLDRALFGAERSPYPLLAATQARLRSPVAAWVAAETDLARGLSDESAFYRGVTLTLGEQEQRATLTRRLGKIQSRILQLLSKTTPTGPDNDELANLKEERGTLETKLSELAVYLSRREVAPLPAVQAQIPLDAALVLWVDVSNRDGTEEHWGCVIRRNGEPSWERLPGSGPDQKWTGDDLSLPVKLREECASGRTSAAALDTLGKRLYAQRIAPLARYLVGVKTLYVVPVNQMAGIPVEVLTGEYTISYLPSGTFLARLRNRPPSSSSALLVLGDPIFSRSRPKPNTITTLPPEGRLILQVVPDGAAAKARLHPGDVLLRYGDVELTTAESLSAAIQAKTAAKEISLTIWRNGVEKPFTRTVAPGRLGVVFAKEPAREAIGNRRKSDAMLLAVRGGDWSELPATRSEATQIAKLFGHPSTTLLDSAASEQSLDVLRRTGELSKFRYLHFATHGEANNVRALESVLILAQDALPETLIPRVGEPLINGQLSANEVLDFWKLDAELVTLSACETAIGRSGGGDGLLGFAQAFLTRGSRAVCLSLWKVDDTATALLMIRFYQNLLGKRDALSRPMPKAQALSEAKRWLRQLSAEEALELTAAATDGVVRGKRGKDEVLKPAVPVVGAKQPGAREAKPFADPRFWAAFILIGDPD